MSREMDHIYLALQSGLHAARSLETWVRGVDARDSVRSDIHSLEDGLKAYERLSRDLRDGRKHIYAPEDDQDHRPHSVNLEKADEGYRLCEMCGGEGTTMIAKMYPTGHTEVIDTCPDCDGEGQIELDEPAMVATQPSKE